MGTLSPLLALCEGNPLLKGANIAWFCVSYVVQLNKLLKKQLSCWEFGATMTRYKHTSLHPWAWLWIWIWTWMRGNYTRSRGNPVRGTPEWLVMVAVRVTHEPPSGAMQLQELKFQSVIYGNRKHTNWHQSFPTHVWLFLAQCECWWLVLSRPRRQKKWKDINDISIL